MSQGPDSETDYLRRGKRTTLETRRDLLPYTLRPSLLVTGLCLEEALITALTPGSGLPAVHPAVPLLTQDTVRLEMFPLGEKVRTLWSLRG